MRVCIIGAGGVGLGLAGFLINAGCEVSIFAQNRTEEALKEGFIITGIFGEFSYNSSQYEIIDDYGQIDNVDYIIVATKAFANKEVAANLCKIKDKIKDSKIVVSQNGWGTAEEFLDCFDKEKIFNARVITGFVRQKPNEVEVTVHADKTIIGNIFKKELSTQVEDLADALNRGGFEALTSKDIEKYIWAKILYNCALNPLGALMGVVYGKLGDSGYTRSIMDNVIDEIYQVMQACGYKTFWNTSDDYKKVFYDRLVPVTYDHKASMLQDIESGKKTEIDSLNGIVVKMAKEKGINTPYNEFLTNAIKFLEDK